MTMMMIVIVISTRINYQQMLSSSKMRVQ